MLKNEIDEIKQYLSNLIKKEKDYFDEGIKRFFDKYKIDYTLIYFPFYKENFYLILKFKNYGIYFNDIEEYFGICKIYNNECQKYADIDDNLSTTIKKLIEFYRNNRLDILFQKNIESTHSISP